MSVYEIAIAFWGTVAASGLFISLVALAVEETRQAVQCLQRPPSRREPSRPSVPEPSAPSYPGF